MEQGRRPRPIATASPVSFAPLADTDCALEPESPQPEGKQLQ